MVTCPYVVRDGQFNPDRRLVNDVGEFDDMANAVFYNALAWALNGSSTYSARVTKYISTWFLDDATYMTPNLNYAQMNRGPKGQNGAHTGLLYVISRQTCLWELYWAVCTVNGLMRRS